MPGALAGTVFGGPARAADELMNIHRRFLLVLRLRNNSPGGNSGALEACLTSITA